MSITLDDLEVQIANMPPNDKHRIEELAKKFAMIMSGEARVKEAQKGEDENAC